MTPRVAQVSDNTWIFELHGGPLRVIISNPAQIVCFPSREARELLALDALQVALRNERVDLEERGLDDFAAGNWFAVRAAQAIRLLRAGGVEWISPAARSRPLG